MLTARANIHHSVLPKVGAVGYLVMRQDRWGKPGYMHGLRQRWQCIGYPLCDNVRPYSLGIHTAWFKALGDTRLAAVRVSGFYFVQV
jgi:hypothetical protein